jgi:hypothetical protein
MATVIGLFEVGAAFFAMPAGVREPQGALTRYFHYGLSTQAKLDHSVGGAGEPPTAIVQAGWIPTELKPPEAEWARAPFRYVVYGMSFTNEICKQLAQVDPAAATLRRAGPAAPLSHSYAMFERDPQRAEAQAVVVGVLSSSLAYLQSMTGLGWTPENPAPYTFPKFEWRDDRLVRIDPVIQDRDTFVREFRQDGPLWAKHLAMLRRQDAYWDAAVFHRSASDHSALLRLVRRAWASRTIQRATSSIYAPAGGYDTSHPALACVPRLLRKMHSDCRRSGQPLVVILLHAQGEPGHLDAWLADDLRRSGVKVVSSVDFFSSEDPQNFVGDGHYTTPNTATLARAVAAAVGRGADE